jgi:hypothetical protein
VAWTRKRWLSFRDSHLVVIFWESYMDIQCWCFVHASHLCFAGRSGHCWSYLMAFSCYNDFLFHMFVSFLTPLVLLISCLLFLEFVSSTFGYSCSPSLAVESFVSTDCLGILLQGCVKYILCRSSSSSSSSTISVTKHTQCPKAFSATIYV